MKVISNIYKEHSAYHLHRKALYCTKTTVHTGAIPIYSTLDYDPPGSERCKVYGKISCDFPENGGISLTPDGFRLVIPCKHLAMQVMHVGTVSIAVAARHDWIIAYSIDGKGRPRLEPVKPLRHDISGFVPGGWIILICGSKSEVVLYDWIQSGKWKEAAVYPKNVVSHFKPSRFPVYGYYLDDMERMPHMRAS